MNKIAIISVSLILALVLGLPACGGEGPSPFSLQVIPEQMEDTVSGQRCVFLVTVEEDNDVGKAVNISDEADSHWWRENTTVTVNPEAIFPGQVAEVTVIPNEKISESWVVVRGERDGLEQTETIKIKVGTSYLDPDGLAPYATELRDKFIPWLAANHPEFGITSQTEWMPSIVRPNIVVVMYYLFFSEDWEMGLRWHVMIPPYDWAEIYLRHRTSEVAPSYAFKISSLEAQDEPHAVEPEASVWR